jgi:hypothetical protein
MLAGRGRPPSVARRPDGRRAQLDDDARDREREDERRRVPPVRAERGPRDRRSGARDVAELGALAKARRADGHADPDDHRSEGERHAFRPARPG